MASSEIIDAKLERRYAEDRLGQDIIDECRTQLMLKFRFLDRALWRMDLEPVRAGLGYALTTDAKRVVYDPPRVIGRFQESFEESVRDYLHLVMHCIFRHPFDEDHDNREAWDLACDVVVENAVMDMCGSRFPSEDDKARKEALSQIAMLAGNLLPNKVYLLLKSMVQTPAGQQYRGLGRSTLNEWHALFERDDHAAWPSHASELSEGDGAFEPAEVSEDDENPDVQADPDPIQANAPDESDGGGGREEASAQIEPSESTEEPEGEEDAMSGQADTAQGLDADDFEEESEGDADAGAHEQSQPADEEVQRQRREWEDVAKEIEMNLETFSKEWGHEAGSLKAHLAFANRKTYSYTEFLRRFMVTSEEMQLNMDEFDYVYYTFGLDMYGNMPLVEPLEYKETKRVHDFVIVIDTSESVRGELVEKFLRHTFSILKSSESYAREVNIHIIQCDARVQSDTALKSLRDVDKLMENFVVRGFGGTDFRPAFGYVTMLRARGELPNLKGLIYFTDGLGSFPEKAPDYDVAFVFMDEEGRELPPVPPWAMKLVLDEMGIER